jgi:hypothetical protein
MHCAAAAIDQAVEKRNGVQMLTTLIARRCSKRQSSKAAVSEEPRRTVVSTSQALNERERSWRSFSTSCALLRRKACGTRHAGGDAVLRV